jgi:hypothetical protein
MAFLDHEGGAEFPFVKEDVFLALIEAIKEINGIEVDKADKLGGRILAKAGVSMTSWGENIPIYIMEVSSGITRVSVTSTPKTGILFGGAFDFGKNRKNIEKIFDKTSSILNKNYLKSDLNQGNKGLSQKCLNCGIVNHEGAKFCAKCGETLEYIKQSEELFCPSCGKNNPNNAIFCCECGNKIDKPEQSKSSYLEDLKKLAELKEKGIITEEEFQAKKKQILGL